jgi:tetratricopeptide (TPR) repeat protein
MAKKAKRGRDALMPRGEPRGTPRPGFFSRVAAGPLAYFVIVLFLACTYMQVASFSFTEFDDSDIVGNLAAALKSRAAVNVAFQTDAFVSTTSPRFYRPFQTLSFVLDLEAENPIRALHLSNLIIHVMTCCALLWFMRLQGIGPLTSFLATLLYSVHPLFVSAVAWIPARGDQLITLFALLSTALLIQGGRKRNILLYACHFALFVAAVLTKETALAFPILYAVMMLQVKRWEFPPFAITVCCIGYAVVDLGYFVLRDRMIGVASPDQTFGLAAFVNNLPAIPEVVSKFLIPVRMAPMPSFSLLPTAAGTLLISAMIVVVVIHRQELTFLSGFGILWFLALSLPPLFFRHTLGSNAYEYLEHRALLPAIGLLMVSAQLAPLMLKKIGRQGLALAGLGISVALSGYAAVHARDYADGRRFYDAAVKANPRSALAFTNRGRVRKDRGDLQGSLEDYNRAITLTPTYFLPVYNRGVRKMSLGDREGALADFNRAVTLNPNHFGSLNNIGVVKMDLKDYPGAIAAFDAALKTDPDSAEAHVNRGLAHAKQGALNAASGDFDQAIRLKPDDSLAYFHRGMVRLGMDDHTGGCSDLARATRLGSGDANLYFEKVCK